jgi:hypothetical protein
MPFTVDTDQQNALSARHFGIAVFVYLNFLGGAIRLSTWNHDITWGANTWTGLGKFISISDAKESEKIETQPLDMSLNIADSAILALAVGESEAYRGRTANLYMCPMEDGVLIGTPIQCWSGTMDICTVSYGADGGGSISMRAKPTSDKLSRPSTFRVNHQLQTQLINPSDLGFEYQADLIANPQLWLSRKFQTI